MNKENSTDFSTKQKNSSSIIKLCNSNIFKLMPNLITDGWIIYSTKQFFFREKEEKCLRTHDDAVLIWMKEKSFVIKKLCLLSLHIYI